MKSKLVDTFLKEVYDLVKDEYIVVGQYSSRETKIEFKHEICGYTFILRPGNFLNGGRCPFCNNSKSNTDLFKKRVYDLVGNEYNVLGEYINNYTKILIKHNICNRDYEVIPSGFVSNGRRCPLCSRKAKKTTEQYRKEVFGLRGMSTKYWENIKEHM